MPSDIPDRDLNVAEFVRQRRRRSRLTQRDLGDLAGVGKRFVVELEAAKPTLRMDKVNQVLAVFGRRLGAIEAVTGGSTAEEHSHAAAALDRKGGLR